MSFGASDCQAGRGSFQLELPRRLSIEVVGIVPEGTFDLKVDLQAQMDLDIALFDLDMPFDGDNSQAIVQWCSAADRRAQANCGVLGAKAGEASATYAHMNITYSGYDGVNGRPGSEYLRISGMATRRLELRVFAFEVGSASVTYSWGPGCGGSFQAKVLKRAVVQIGQLPRGVRGLRVSLQSASDVDIQLYDVEDTFQFPEGAAIVAYCSPESTCNYGALTGSGPQQGWHEGAFYRSLRWT